MSKKTTKPESDSLRTWAELLEGLKTANEKECWALLDKEKKGKRRIQFMLRIYGRANRMRTDREHKELMLDAK